MSGVHRLLTRKDKKHKAIETVTETVIEHGDLGGVFTLDSQAQKKKTDKEEEKRVKAVKGRLQGYGITKITTSNIEYALRNSAVDGNVDEALRLCLLLEDTYEGLLKSFNPSTKLLGAVNRDGVTCYLDALLFAMFARLDGFEAMLYNSLEDAPRKKLAGLLRLWVNLLRTGRLITTDVTKHVQAALAECGWEAANKLEQQDTSEAFTFITGQLELPLLTLKMDLYHTGKEDPQDDHKFVNERLLEVAVMDEAKDGKESITLEDCLEHYFNNRVEVKRHLDRVRRQSFRTGPEQRLERQTTMEKLPDLHIESVELGDMPETPTVSTPLAETPTMEVQKKGPVEQLRPSVARSRADSIFSQRRVRPSPEETLPENDAESVKSSHTKKTKGSIRTEVLMPAWQFFKLLPWYTDSMPTSDAQVAAHFATKRPILGICLKRYIVTNKGVCERLNTYVDIPLEIAVPDFVSDDSMEEGSPLVGNFKLVLQSVVCHRGKSLHSGHYIALVRGHAANAANGAERPSSSSTVTNDNDDGAWMLFDDLARERVRYVNIAKALKDECPYLLFYQVQPIDEDEPMMSGPPSYDEAISRSNSEHYDLTEKSLLPEYSNHDVAVMEPQVDEVSNGITTKTSKEELSPRQPPSRTSLDVPSRTSMDVEARRGRVSFEQDDRQSAIFTASGPSTPNEEGARLGFLNLPSRRGSRQSNTNKKSKSRPTSIGVEPSNRFSLNMSRLTTRISKSELPQVAGTPTVQVDSELSLAEGDKTSMQMNGGSGEAERPVSRDAMKDVDAKLARKLEKQAAKDEEDARKKRKKSEVPDRDCRVM